MDQRRIGPLHTPVLIDEVLALLDPKPGEHMIDTTAGDGGHAERLLDRLVPGGFLLMLDRDEEAVRACTEKFANRRENVLVAHENYANLKRAAGRMKFESVDGILADLGVSSRHLDEAGRGFSFRQDGPLDMRFSRTIPRSAADLVNGSTEAELTRIFQELGEERWSGPIARMILRRRPIQTTRQLADTVQAAVPRARWPRNIHPATRVFQALRIAVNEELESLRDLVKAAPELLAPGGRLVILAYHSLEDRIVKQAFRALAAAGGFELLNKKPIRASGAEVRRNPRARSALLRGLRRSG